MAHVVGLLFVVSGLLLLYWYLGLYWHLGMLTQPPERPKPLPRVRRNRHFPSDDCQCGKVATYLDGKLVTHYRPYGLAAGLADEETGFVVAYKTDENNRFFVDNDTTRFACELLQGTVRIIDWDWEANGEPPEELSHAEQGAGCSQ